MPCLTEQRKSMCVCVCVGTCLSKKRERELVVEVMLMHIGCLQSIVHSVGLDHDACAAS